jgi:F-type H+-transporting ATPase subunit alpha
MVGRVVTPCFPIDGKPIGGDLYQMPLERKKGVIFRQPVTEPLQTGLKDDAIYPLVVTTNWLLVTVKQVNQLFVLLS